jgi:hypothetical protein
VPWLSGQEHSGLVAELGQRFANTFETPLHRIGYESVFFEGRRVQVFRVSVDRLTVLNNIERRLAGLSKSNRSVPIDFLLESWLSDRLLHYIDSRTEQFRKILPEPFALPEIVKAARREAFVKPNRNIDIARI